MKSGRIGVFLDRDGTLNEEVDFVRSPDQLRMIDGAAAAVRRLNDLGVVTCVISNQSGVARGFMTEEDLVPIHAKLELELDRGGARVDAIYYCPHHPTAGIPLYKIECECRKPKPGMLLRGAREFGIDLKKSFVVGDSLVDMQAGTSVGAATVLVLTGYGKSALESCRQLNIKIDNVAETISEAVDFIALRLKGEMEPHE